MAEETVARERTAPPQISAVWLTVRLAVAIAIVAGMLFFSAGRWDLPMFWVYLGSFVVFVAVTMGIMLRHDPELLRERFRPAPGRRERITRPLLVPPIVAHWVIAGLDLGRFQWSQPMPAILQIAALAAMWLGMFGWAWAMYSNHFFSSEVRIQAERGHRVVDSGPYGIVRHPGYLSGLILFAADPLVLGSWASAIPMLAVLGVFVWRTAFEDRVLRAELAGYAEYAQRVRFRLVPGIW
jgi:protein-S-isoprenylcysteine O-methyltransferase Ste14